jgi:hypothetical protein
MLLLAGCTFQGGGIVPLVPAPAPPAEVELDVPFVPTPEPVGAAMLDMAVVGECDYLIDIGSGDGRIAIMAAQRGARTLGVDIDPVRISEAVMAARIARVEERARFRRQDLFDTPLREADIVTLYLLPDVNLRLRPRLLTELRAGARVVSHNFAMGDWRPDATREVGASRIYLWIVPAVAEGEWQLETVDGRTWPLRLEQRFQDVSGTLDGHALRDVVLRGRVLAFSADLPDGARTFRGIVEDGGIVPDPAAAGAETGWRARRVG